MRRKAPVVKTSNHSETRFDCVILNSIGDETFQFIKCVVKNAS